MFKFIHAADIHLDSPLRGLEAYEGAPIGRLRRATRQALTNLVDLAISEAVDFVLIAGDLYDGDWQDFNTGLFFNAQMLKLREAQIPVLLIAGNHDAASQIARTLRLPGNVHAFGTEASSVDLDGLPVTVHGQSYPTRAVSANLARSYPPERPGRFNIGLLHTCAGGYEGHEPYAPCSLPDLLDYGYDYWALGHVHTRVVLREAEPWVGFPGNLQGRHARECGSKGCTLVRVDDSHGLTCQHRPLDVLRWTVLDIDAAEAPDPPAVVERICSALEAEVTTAEGRALAVRLQVCGACSAHGDLVDQPEKWRNEIRSAAMAATDGAAWIEKVSLRTSPAIDEAALRQDDGPVGDLLRYLDLVASQPPMLQELSQTLDDLRHKLPPSLCRGDSTLIDLTSPAALRDLLEAARHLLLARLMTGADR